MKPENRSLRLLGVTRSKAKMYEYSVAREFHITIDQSPTLLFRLTIGILGDASVSINTGILDEEQKNEFQQQLLFAAQFFDTFLLSRLDEQIDYYLLLLGSAAYYLCSLPGSSSVLINRVGNNHPDLDCLGLDNLLLWLLQGNFSKSMEGIEGLYSEYISEISQQIIEYFRVGIDIDRIFNATNRLRQTSYLSGTDRELLIADVISAVTKKRLENAARNSLPTYSGLTLNHWLSTLQKKTFVQELWPAQHLIGQRGVLKGKSAIIQLPTSAGKTKSIEMMIRSAFLSERANVAVIVTPFRALCHEIKRSLLEAFAGELVSIDDPSDVYQLDFDLEAFLDLSIKKKILITTPEKLTYLLRQSPDLAKSIGLLVYDEGHQFDNGSRGVTYELLLSSLKTLIPTTCQSVLISAVISNAESIGEWLNGKGNETIAGSNLLPTYRTIAFASWMDQLGRLEFVEQENPDNPMFFVPRIIEQQKLQLKKTERKERVFPERSDGSSIALYLGIKLAPNGSVAIFCGQKATVTTICKQVVDIFDRGIQYQPPINCSDQNEVQKLSLLHIAHMDVSNDQTKCAQRGIFTHSRNTPEGLRLAIEYAMQKDLVKFVICTSTLAQGVNLPIRYLIVTSIYQAQQLIKTRDFHNLLGRTGRSGMHTEGSILFADPEVYASRSDFSKRWRWTQVKSLLDPKNSEPCASSLLSIFEWHSDNRRNTTEANILAFTQEYMDDPSKVLHWVEDIYSMYATQGYTRESIERQIEEKVDVITSIESYLMAYWIEVENGPSDDDISNFAKGTLAYYLSNEVRKSQLVEIFRLIANNIKEKIPEAMKRKALGKTLCGIHDSIDIERWLLQNHEQITSCKDIESLIRALWPVLYSKIQNKIFRKCSSEVALQDLTIGWIQGISFHKLFEQLRSTGAQIIARTKGRQFKLENIIEICESALGYEGTLIIGAITEIFALLSSQDNSKTMEAFLELQKRLRYGLPQTLSAVLYELGFSDRVVAMDLSSAFRFPDARRVTVIRVIQQNRDEIQVLLNKYPSYFSHVLNSIEINGNQP